MHAEAGQAVDDGSAGKLTIIPAPRFTMPPGMRNCRPAAWSLSNHQEDKSEPLCYDNYSNAYIFDLIMIQAKMISDLNAQVTSLQAEVASLKSSASSEDKVGIRWIRWVVRRDDNGA